MEQHNLYLLLIHIMILKTKDPETNDISMDILYKKKQRLGDTP